MEKKIWLKNKKEPIIYNGDKIDILDFNMNNTDYIQIRCFKNGRSKSELILKELIIKIK